MLSYKYTLEKLVFPVNGYFYYVMTWRSIDNGKTFYYCGDSKYFRTKEDALAYKKEREKRIS